MSVPTSILQIYAERFRANATVGPVLFRAVAEQIRSRLDPDDAAIVAAWFDKLADGQEPNKVFRTKRRGRPKGSRVTKNVSGTDLMRPDDLTLCWTIREGIAETGDEDAVFAEVARRYGLEKDSVRDIYRDVAPTLTKD